MIIGVNCVEISPPLRNQCCAVYPILLSVLRLAREYPPQVMLLFQVHGFTMSQSGALSKLIVYGVYVY
jgi:hypothetical protein